MTRFTRENVSTAPSRSAAAVISPANSRDVGAGILTLGLFVALAVIALLAAPASAQAPKYSELPVDPQIDKNLVTYQREARAFATAPDLSSYSRARATAVQKYFTEYVPAKITQRSSPHMINEIMDHAKAALTSSVRSRKPAARNLSVWLYTGLKKVAFGNYHPAARINAIQFISQMARPAASGGIPQPYPFVLSDNKELYLNESNPDAVRAAALQGLDRYVRYTNPNAPELKAAKAELIQEMTKLLESDSPTGRDPLAHAFLQRYAVNILTNLSSDASIGKQLVSLSLDEKKPNLIALHSAAAIGRLPGKMAADDVEADKVLQEWSKRILAAYDSELVRFKRLEEKPGANVRQPPPPESFLRATEDPAEKTAASRLMAAGEDMGMDESAYEMEAGMDMEMMMEAGGMEDMMGGGYSGMAVAKPSQPAEIKTSRKKLNHVIQQVMVALTGSGEAIEDIESLKADRGLMAALPADKQAKTKQWLQSVLDMTAQLNDPNLSTNRNFVKMLEEQREILTLLSEGKPAEQRARPGGTAIPGLDDLLGGEGASDPALEGLLN